MLLRHNLLLLKRIRNAGGEDVISVNLSSRALFLLPQFSPDVMIQVPVVFAAFSSPFVKALANFG